MSEIIDFDALLARERSEVAPAVESSPEVVDPDQFFGKQGLLHASLRAAVLDIGPIAVGAGRVLWYYRDGVWLPGGDDEIRRRCRVLLGQRWRKAHTDGLIADLLADEVLITGEQPREWINTRSGLLDWRTGELHPHDPLVPSTCQLDVEWDPAATCPTIDEWLAMVAPADAIDLVWEVIGTAICADQPFHRAVMLFGPGRNGKGTLLRLITKMIGSRHVSNVTIQALGENRFAAAELFGKVANIAGDLDARAIRQTDTFKMLTGGDAIMAERKFGSPFMFTSQATMLFSANELPGSADMSDGFFRRWVIVPFTGLQLGPGDEDPTIEPRMHAELTGALVKAVEGLRRAVARGGYDLPESVQAATEEYQRNSDSVLMFAEEVLEITGSEHDTLARGTVYNRYRDWCVDNGSKPVSARKFWPRLEHGSGGRLNPDGPKIQGARHASGVNFAADGDGSGTNLDF